MKLYIRLNNKTSTCNTNQPTIITDASFIPSLIGY
jgi:hypothetical protein